MRRGGLFFLALLLAFLFGLKLHQGAMDISSAQILKTLLGAPVAGSEIVMQIRLPRALMALGVGWMLGLGGAVMQGFLRNPLAEPGVLGISSAAALGAVLVLQFGFLGTGYMAPQIMALLLSAFVAGLLVLFARHEPVRLLLTGIGVSALCGALVSLALNLSPNPYAAYDVMFWLMGSVENLSLHHVYGFYPFLVLGTVFLVPLARPLDALSLGADTAYALGVNLKRTSFLMIAGVSLGVGAAVAHVGIIGFVGLLAPHMARAFFGARPGGLLFPSALLGGCLLLGADILLETPPLKGHGLELGTLTSLIGVPFFIYLVTKNRIRL